MFLAKRQIIGNAHPADASHNESEDILERADKLYNLNGFAGHERDKERGPWFRNILNWMIRTHDPKPLVLMRFGLTLKKM